MEKNTSITENDSNKKKPTLSSEISRIPLKTPNETASKSSSISNLCTGLLSYFSKNCQCPRRNSENTTKLLVSNKPIEAKSTTSGSKENQIPEELIKKIQPSSSSTQTYYFTRWARNKFISIPLILIGSYIVLKVSKGFLFSLWKKGENAGQKWINNLHTAKYLTRPAPVYEQKKFSDTSDNSLTHPISPDELEHNKFKLGLSDNIEYLKDKSDKNSENIEKNTYKVDEMHSYIKQVGGDIKELIKYGKNSTINNTLSHTFTLIVGSIVGYQFHKRIVCISSTAHNDNDPIKGPPDHQNHHVSPEITIIKKLSRFDLPDDESSCSSTGSGSPSLKGASQATNGTENFMPITRH